MSWIFRFAKLRHFVDYPTVIDLVEAWYDKYFLQVGSKHYIVVLAMNIKLLNSVVK